jgi:hypothetical protein
VRRRTRGEALRQSPTLRPEMTPEGRWRDSLGGGGCAQLGHCARPRLSPRFAPVVGCSPALHGRPGRRLRAPSLAGIVDNGAYTGRLGYAHSTLRSGSRPTPSPALVQRLRNPIFWTMAHILIAWAAPTRRLRQAPARTLSQGPMALSDPRRPGGPYGDVVGSVAGRSPQPRPRPATRPWRALRARPAASGCDPPARPR